MDAPKYTPKLVINERHERGEGPTLQECLDELGKRLKMDPMGATSFVLALAGERGNVLVVLAGGGGEIIDMRDAIVDRTAEALKLATS